MNRKAFVSCLKSVCVSTTDEVFKSAKSRGFVLRSFNSTKNEKRRYAFRPGVSSTSPLVVCHADTVVNGGAGPHAFAYDAKSDTVNSIALDDRLGIACMFDAIDRKSPLADCAMLICDDEEIGYSSAQVFKEKIKPNFMVELDRRGVDVVCYDYDSVLLRSLLRSCDFTIGTGSFSDICYLQSLGVVGFNVGIGYHREHSLACHAKLADTEAQLKRLLAFIAKFGDIRLDYDEYDSNSAIDAKWWKVSTTSKTTSIGSKLPSRSAEWCDACQNPIHPSEYSKIVQGFVYCEDCDSVYNRNPDSLSADDFPGF